MQADQYRYISSDIAACYLRFAISLQIGLPIEENLASYSVIILPGFIVLSL